MIGCLTDTTTCVVAKPLVYIKLEVFSVQHKNSLVNTQKVLMINANIFFNVFGLLIRKNSFGLVSKRS